MPIDPVALTADLVRRRSVTPTEGGALRLLQTVLEPLGFDCTRIDREGVPNLYARIGSGRPVLGFAGHTDVVPPGDPAGWSVDPFGGLIRDGKLWGRGAADMKSGIGAFVSAAASFLEETPGFDGSLALLITGDEEGDADHGTVAILDWMLQNGEQLDHCIVGEPTCPTHMGEMIKVGRRGSLTAWFTAKGRQGHSAYPHRAANPAHPLVRMLNALAGEALDNGTEHFDPSTLAITTIDIGNPATNVIPGEATATVNIRFNDAHSGASLAAWIRGLAEAHSGDGVAIDVRIKVSGESFLTPPGAFSDLLSAAVEAETGQVPALSTSGGTSDARFIKNHCPVVELGLVGQTMHQADEHVETAHIESLSRIYRLILDRYFETSAG